MIIKSFSSRLAKVADGQLLDNTDDCSLVKVFASEAALKLYGGAEPMLNTCLFMLPYLPGLCCEKIPIADVSLLHLTYTLLLLDLGLVACYSITRYIKKLRNLHTNTSEFNSGDYHV